MQSTVCLLTWDNILALFEKVQKRIVLVMPAIHEEWVTAIYALQHHKKLDVWVCFDNQEKAFRSGYGDIKAIEKLIEERALIKQSADLRLSYLGVDDTGYALFLESRILGGNPEGLNAIALPESVSEGICKAIFPEQFITQMFSKPHEKVETLNKIEFNVVQKAIKKNPPTEPDLQREISVYSNQFQFVELKLEGGNLTGKTVNIPSSALPFKDASLKEKMNTRYNLFEKEDTDEWTEIKEIKEKIEEIREKYLVSCSVRKGKRVLKKNEKLLYQAEIKAVEELIKKNSDAMGKRVTNAIMNAELVLAKELRSFLESFPPDSVNPTDSPEMREHKIGRAVNSILDQTKFPAASELISKLKLVHYFYDLTWEDLKDGELIKWFKENELISEELENQLASFSKAYEVKR
jgi:hypothetical protein